MGTLEVLRQAHAAGCRRICFAASSAAYGNSEELPKVESMRPSPLSPYASGKLGGEALLEVWGRTHGMHTAALRYFNIFGPRQADDSPYTGVIAIFARALLEGRRVTIHGDGEQSRDFTYVADVVRANLLAMESTLEPGEVLNVGAGTRVTLNELYAEMARLCGVDEPPIHGPERSGDVRHSLASLDRIRSVLGYEPSVSWKEGIAKTVEWYRGRVASAR